MPYHLNDNYNISIKPHNSSQLQYIIPEHPSSKRWEGFCTNINFLEKLPVLEIYV